MTKRTTIALNIAGYILYSPTILIIILLIIVIWINSLVRFLFIPFSIKPKEGYWRQWYNDNMETTKNYINNITL